MDSENYTNVIELGLCEYTHLYLRPNQLYRFIVMPNCEDCAKLAEYAKLPNNMDEAIKSLENSFYQ